MWTLKPSNALLALSLALAVVLGSYGPGLIQRGFSYDDAEAIAENPVVRGDVGWLGVVDRDYWHHRGAVGHYRPTATALLRLDYDLYGADGRGYRATNILLHLGVAGLLVLWSLRRAPGALPLGALLFAAHPALADSVAWISGRTSMAAVLPPLAAAAILATRPHLSLRWTLPIVFSMCLAGLGAKEDAVALLPLVVLSAGSWRRGWPVAAAAIAALLTYLLARVAIYGSPWPSAAGAPLAALPLLERLAFGGRALVEALRISVWPFGFPPSYRGDLRFAASAQPALAWAIPSVLVLLGALTCFPAFLWSVKWRRSWLPCVGVACLALVPMTQLVPVAEPFAPRYLYLPLAALAPLVCWRRTRLTVLASCALLLIGCLVTAKSATGYANRASHARAILLHQPEDALALTSLGVAQMESGDVAAARAAFEAAIVAKPNHGRAWSNLGAIALEAGEFETAVQIYERSLQHFPNNGIAWCNLGNARHRLSDAQGALEAYQHAVDHLPGLGAAWRGLGRCWLSLGNPREAAPVLERALRLNPNDRAAQRLLGEISDGDF